MAIVDMDDLAGSELFGMPVTGTALRRRRPAQLGMEHLEPLLLAVLEHPEMVAFGWYQGTQIHNDGELQDFVVHTVWFRTVHDDEDGTEDHEGFWPLTLDALIQHPSLGRRLRRWDAEKREYVTGSYQGKREELYDTAAAFALAISGGAYQEFLIEAFGEDAAVKVDTRARSFRVELHESA